VVKKTTGICTLFCLLLWSCATYQPPPPSFYIGSLPQSAVSLLSLDERILAEDAWRNLKIGNADKAVKIFSKLGTGSPLYLAGMGYANYVRREKQRAEDFFLASLREYPQQILSRLGLAQLYLESDRDEQAFSECRKVLNIEPDHPWAKPQYENIKQRKTEDMLNAAQDFIAAENQEAGKAAYLKVLYYSPESTQAHLALAGIYNQEEKPENALIHIKAAYDKNPQNESILETYGEILFASKENAKSLDVYEKLLELDPGHQIAQERVETLKNRLGIFELPSQYNSIPSSEAVTKEQMAALLSVKFKNILVLPTTKPPIIIDISTSWAAKFILQISALSILDIYPNHTFQPNKIISRAEMAETTNRLLNHLEQQGHRFIQQIPPGNIKISDVSPDNYYYNPILMMISYDLMSLAPGKTFNPDRPVSGREIVRLLDVILGLIR